MRRTLGQIAERPGLMPTPTFTAPPDLEPAGFCGCGDCPDCWNEDY